MPRHLSRPARVVAALILGAMAVAFGSLFTAMTWWLMEVLQ